MPQIISCPDCGRKLRVPENLLGKKVKCPGCDVTFTAEEEEPLDELAEAEAPPRRSRRSRDERIAAKPTKSRRRDEEEEEDDDEPQRRKPKKRDIYKGWERVSLGLNLVAISIWILIGGFVATVLLSCVVGSTLTPGYYGPPNAGPVEPFDQQPVPATVGAGAAGLLLVSALTLLISLAYMGAQMTGFGFCMGVVSTPKTQGLKGLAIATFGASVGILIFQMLAQGVQLLLGPNGAPINLGASILSFVLFLTVCICFLLFMRGVAVAMRDDALARAVVVYMITIGAVIGLFVLLSFILAFAGMAAAFTAPAGPGAVPNVGRNLGGLAILGCSILLFMGGGSIALIVRFMTLLYQVRSVVNRWLNRN